ncbi:MAG: MFS transporter [Chthoniobacterales bacterium]|nr:MFS transporter [Chthoniobacterales bacterium]
MNVLKELKIFFSYPHSMRVLLTTNFIYASVLPVIWAFVGVYIMRNSNNDVHLVMCFPMANYTGILITFFLNGYLLRIIRVKYLYALGMLISGFSLFIMISLKELDIYGITMTGGLLGVAMGLFWANRDYLALASTTDENRNYYYGLENFFLTICSILAPITVGWFIAGSQLYGWFGGDRNHAYFFVAIGAIILAFLASVIICRGNFTNPEATKFVYWKYDPLWYKVCFMEALRGIGQGFMITAPAMLTVKLIGGQEGALGIIQTTGNILLVLVFYSIARLTRPEHRIWILFVGLGLFVVGCTCNAILFSAVGVLAFMACQIISSALIECSFSPVMMLVIDLLSKKEQRNKFAYLLNNEFAIYVGRLTGGLLFIGAAIYISDVFALRYVLLLVGVLQFCSYFLCKQVLATCKVMDAELTEYDLRTEPHAIADLLSIEER